MRCFYYAKIIDKTGDIAKTVDKIADTSRFVLNSKDYAKLADKIADSIKMSSKVANNTKLANNILSSIKSVEKIKDSAKTLDLAFSAKDIYKTFDIIHDTGKSFKAIDQTLSLTDQVNDIFKYNKNIDDIVDSYKKIDNITPNKGIDSPNNLSKIQNDDIINKRRTWRQSEQKTEQLFSDYSKQKSFIDGNSTNYGKKGSSRPDLYKEGSSIEVKNYDLTKPEGLNRLINNLKQNSAKRTKNIPSGTVQHLIVDAAGQELTSAFLKKVKEKIISEIDSIGGITIWID